MAIQQGLSVPSHYAHPALSPPFPRVSTFTNLGYLTDSIFHQEDGLIEQRSDYAVVRTPSNPSFWFVVRQPPALSPRSRCR